MTQPAISPRRPPSALLAPLAGTVPPAPDWFSNALASAPERHFIEVEKARIEVLIWGDKGRPGLLFLHGNGAHADWWDFIAPAFADRYRVAALSWSGMGRSDWREDYSIDLHVDEAAQASAFAGLFDGGAKPFVVAHSFGSFPVLRMAQRMGVRLAGVVIVDPPLFAEATKAARKPADPDAFRLHRSYPSLAEALARFRFAPEQDCANLFIADHIARHSIRECETGWTWRFDPKHWRRGTRKHDFDAIFRETPVKLALMLGARSGLYNQDDRDHLDALCAASGTPKIVIPDAAHHIMVDQPLAFIDEMQRLLEGFSPRGE